MSLWPSEAAIDERCRGATGEWLIAGLASILPGVRVALFVTCLTDTYFPRVGEAVVRVLRHFGCTVDFPVDQTCCGQPAFNAGFRDDAVAVARRMIEVFAPYDHIVTPSASCAAMVCDQYPALFPGDAEWAARAERLATRTNEFSKFLTDVLGIDLAEVLRIDEPVTLHYPCHARHVYPVRDPVELLQRCAPQFKPPAHLELCCGFGGTFSVDFADVSGAMLRDRLDELSATGARTVVCNEGGCALNLMGGAHRLGRTLRFKHLAECVAESLGLMPEEADRNA